MPKGTWAAKDAVSFRNGLESDSTGSHEHVANGWLNKGKLIQQSYKKLHITKIRSFQPQWSLSVH